jgi:hypothetical protein
MRPLYSTVITLWTEADPLPALDGVADRVVAAAGVELFVGARERTELVKNSDHDEEWSRIWDDADLDVAS